MSNSKKRRLKKEQDKIERQRILAERTNQLLGRAEKSPSLNHDLDNIVGFGHSPNWSSNKRNLNGHDTQHEHDWHQGRTDTSCNNVIEILYCGLCNGMVRKCDGCDHFHASDVGFGGEDSMPEVVDFEWLKKNECSANTVDSQVTSQINENGLNHLGDTTVWIDVPVPFVELPSDYDEWPADVASYEGELGSTRFELVAFEG